MMAAVAIYAAMYGAFWATGHFFGSGVQHVIAWLVITGVVSYYAADYADTKRRLKNIETLLKAIPLT